MNRSHSPSPSSPRSLSLDLRSLSGTLVSYGASAVTRTDDRPFIVLTETKFRKSYFGPRTSGGGITNVIEVSGLSIRVSNEIGCDSLGCGVTNT
jgi:hypothetical protein